MTPGNNMIDPPNEAAWELFRSMAMLLNGSMEALEAAAQKERKAEECKPMPRCTAQLRLECARECVARAFAMQGIEP